MGNDQYGIELHQRKGDDGEDSPTSSVRQHEMEKSTVTDRDVIDKQTRIQRLFSFGQIFAFSLTFMSSWEAMVSNMGLAFYNGGPQTLIWSMIIGFIGALAQSASIAELASIIPISGAQYHWAHHLAPPKHRRLITWVQAWLTWFGFVSMLAGVADVNIILLTGIINLNNPEFEATRWQIALLVIFILIIQALINQYAFWIIPWVELVSGLLHVILFIIFMVVLVTMGSRHSAEFVFTKQDIESGWSNTFVAWNIGMITACWCFVGFDGVVHMSEEVRKSKQAVPRAVFWSIALNGTLAIAMALAVLFCMGPLENVLNSSLPIATILQEVTGSTAAATALMCGLFVVSYAAFLATIASASRLTWAWARDGGLPAWFAYIDPVRRVPVRSVWLPVFLVCLLSLLNIASSAAFGAIIALSTISLYMSYFVVISCMVYARFRKDVPLVLGGWNLGRFGIFINIYALVYTLWIFIFLPFPEYMPVTWTDMNYSGPIILICLLFVFAYWFLRGRHHWPGLNVEVIKYVLESE